MNSRAVSIPEQIRAALEAFDIHPVSASILSPLEGRKGVQATWKIESAEGRILKARSFPSTDQARRVLEIQARLGPAFAAPLDLHESVVLEEWIEGTPLSAPTSAKHLEEAGVLLGCLHATPLGNKILPAAPTQAWIERTARNAEQLVEAHHLSHDQASTLLKEIAARDPGTYRNAIIHTDFCAENLVADTNGNLRVIDNEHLAVGPAGLDLGSTFCRWPMSADEWSRFRRGYRSSAPFEPEAAEFWRIVAALLSARVFFQHGSPRLKQTTLLLLRFAAGDDLAEGSP